ncbi:MAG: polymer-forming cytoskeletal protein [Rhodospirillales bacterium]|nr:polymer-forming cytoskeletal protein [Rhodospirillales bacterium]
MFRSKKGAQSSVEDAVEAAETMAEAPAETELPKAPPRRALPPQVRGAPGSGFPFELARRSTDLGGASLRPDYAGGQMRENTILVGQGARLQGELLTCERLVVEGEATLTVHSCRQVQIGEAGSFRGTFDVAEADISGDFEGELVARDRLTVRSTGRVRGRIRYRHIIIEAGGLIIGDVNELDPEMAAAGAETAPMQGEAVGSSTAAGPSVDVVREGMAETSTP